MTEEYYHAFRFLSKQQDYLFQLFVQLTVGVELSYTKYTWPGKSKFDKVYVFEQWPCRRSLSYGSRAESGLGEYSDTKTSGP